MKQGDVVLIGDYQLGVVSQILPDEQVVVCTEGGHKAYPAEFLVLLDNARTTAENMATHPDSLNPYPPYSLQWAWWEKCKNK